MICERAPLPLVILTGEGIGSGSTYNNKQSRTIIIIIVQDYLIANVQCWAFLIGIVLICDNKLVMS